MTIKTMAAVLAATLALGACGMPNYVPAHDQTVEQLAADRLDCKMISEGMTPGPQGGFVAASGKPAFVGGVMGGYALGLAIGAAIQQQHRIELYDDCMVAHGYRKATDVAATVTAPLPAPLPPPQSAPALPAPVPTPVSSTATRS